MSQQSERGVAERLRLRGPMPAVARLSRRTIVVLSLVCAVALAVVAAWTLTPHRAKGPPPAEAATPAAPTNQIAVLPKDYAALPTSAPRLGPPLPGDLGKPFLEARLPPPPPPLPPRAGSPPGEATPPVDPVASSGLFASGARAAAGPPAPSDAPSIADRRAAFISAAPAAGAQLQPPASPYILQAGSIVPAVLVTGVRSDLPGPVVAQVSEDVYDSAQGRWLLIPQGSRLLGVYDAQVGFGQQRLLVAWTRLILPDGRAIDLGREPAADAQGYAGLSDQVDRKWKQIGGAAAVSTLLGVGAQLGAGSSDSQVVQALRNGVANGANQAGQQLVGKSLDIQPTLTVRSGLPVRLLLTRDLILAPWPGGLPGEPAPAPASGDDDSR